MCGQGSATGPNKHKEVEKGVGRRRGFEILIDDLEAPYHSPSIRVQLGRSGRVRSRVVNWKWVNGIQTSNFETKISYIYIQLGLLLWLI